MGVAAELLGEHGVIDVARFSARVLARAPVGWCGCGALLDGQVERGRGMLWCTTRCRDCGTERSSPGGRTRPAYGRERGDPHWQARWLLAAVAESERAEVGAA